jgi:PPOX class probable F420-dependent enzyme
MAYHAMSDEEVRAFLASDPPHTAKIATVRADGSPHIAPVWFAVDDEGSIVFTTGSGTQKGKTIQRDARVAVCIDDERPPFSFVVIEGVAEIVDDADALLRWATVIGGRYMGPDRAEEYGKRNAVPGELLVRVRARKVVAEAELSA